MINLKTPLSKEIIKKLNVGDIVYLNGIIYTGRDEAHLTILEEGEKPESKIIVEKLKHSAIYHAGPIMKKENNKWECVAIGPTTSARMNNMEEEFIKITEISAIVGKGGMKDELLDIFNTHGVVYLGAPGGCAALLANSIVEVKGVYYEELGMPEAFWELDVKDFGPLVVSMDANGNSIYKKVNYTVNKNLEKIISEMG